MKLSERYNKSKFSIYDSEEKSVLKLLESISKINEDMFNEFDNLSSETTEKLNYLLNNGLTKELSIKIKEMKDSGELSSIINDIYLDVSTGLENKEEKKTTFNEEYESIITDEIYNVSYDTILQNIGALHDKYPHLLSVEEIGLTLLGRSIKAVILGDKTVSNKLLVIGGHHAREQHSATIVLKQLELYCENWENLYNGERVKDIFKNTSLFVIPSLNPDGLELCRIGIDSIPSTYSNRETLINSIKLALETKIKTNLQLNKDVTVDYDLPIVWEGETGKVANYVFRNKDMYMWKGNANGVDLHYNCYEDGYNGEFVKKWASENGYNKGFASENYIGVSGFSELENKALKNFIEKYDLWTYSITYHGKGPTCFWNYGQTGQQLRRTLKITEELSKISNTPFSPTVNGNVGFSGYMLSKSGTNYLTTSMIRETGWGNEKINLDNNYVDSSSPYTVSPLHNWQQPHIWKAEKYIPIHFIQKYVRRQDIVDRDVNISTFDLSSKLNSSNGFFTFPVTTGTQMKLLWGTTSLTFNNNQVVMTTIEFEEKFKSANFIVGANCFNNVADNKFTINCSKELNQIVIRVYSPTALTGNFSVNWFALGV